MTIKEQTLYHCDFCGKEEISDILLSRDIGTVFEWHMVVTPEEKYFHFCCTSCLANWARNRWLDKAMEVEEAER